MADRDHIDPEGYWIDPDRNIHRKSLPDPDGEQTTIASVTPECSEAEFNLIREAFQLICAKRSILYDEWSGHYRTN
jgi:hypothetical protein